MKQLELVIVQFEEVKRLIGIGRVPQLRLAFILLDSAVELIMYRMIQSEWVLQAADYQFLENYRRFEAAGRGTDETRATVKELEGRVTSNTRRKKIDQYFAEKIDFLVEKDRLPDFLGPVLKRLHEYRNETYHRDQHRTEVIRPAVLIYFDAACTVLSLYRPQQIGHAGTPLGPELTRFHSDPRDLAPFDLPARVAEQLRQEVGLDLDTVRTALGQHLLERLRDLEDNLEFIEQNATGDLEPGDGIRAIQVDNDDTEALSNNEIMRSRTYPYTESDLTAWRHRAEALADITDKHALFTEFASIETSFEKIERRASDVVGVIEEALELQLDIHRGK